MIRRPPRSTPLYSSAASDVYKRQEPVEDHHIIHPVQELRLEGGLHGLHHPRSHIFLGEVGVQNPLTADVAGHDDHSVPEADGATVAVCQPSLIKNLQQDIEHVRMGLLDLVQEKD